MNKNFLLSTLISTISAAVSWALISLIMDRRIDWPSLLAFIVVFAVVFNITIVLFRRKEK